MRTKQIISGLNNSQKFRFILMANDGTEFGMTMTIQQMSEQFATQAAREAVWMAMNKLAFMRVRAKQNDERVPTGLVFDVPGFRQVQVDLH